MITATDITNMNIAANGTPTMEVIIAKLIEENSTSPMQEGIDYFNNRNDILEREITYWKDGAKTTDEASPNNRIPNNYHKILVRQKMGYLVGKPLTFTDKESKEDEEGNTNSPNEEFVNEINTVLDEEWDDVVNELVKGASNKGVEWLHTYIDEVEEGVGGFKFTVIDAREVIPIWETSKQIKLEAVLRYYYIWVNDKERIKAEWWTKYNVTYYVQDDSGEFIKDDNGESSHYYSNGVGYGWGAVPFISFKNNEEMVSDLQDYKHLIDIYDKIYADGANNIEQIQDAIWVLKNYEGTTLDEFRDNLKKYKALPVDEKGGADAKTVEIPVESRETFLDRTEDSIYTFGMGVNVSTDKFGQNPSGVALKFLYALLDLKCDTLERKFKKAIRELLWFIAEYYKIIKQNDYNHKAIDITFNRSMITNEAEKIQSAQQSKGIISDETVVANHPWVDDPQDEIERLKEQNKELNLYDERLGQELNEGVKDNALE